MTKKITISIDAPPPDADLVIAARLEEIAEALAIALVSNEIFIGTSMTIDAKVASGDKFIKIVSKPQDIARPKVYSNQYSNKFDSVKDERGVATWLPKEKDK